MDSAFESERVQRALFEEGAMFVVTNVPSNTEIGIDYNCWRTGDKFKGIKMIPPGVHFIYWSSTDKYGNVAMRNGFFYNFSLNEIVYKQWNKQTEGIEPGTANTHNFDEDIARIRSNKYDIDRFLGAYPYDQYKKWISLSSRLTAHIVDELMPDTGVITSESTLIGQEFSSKTKRGADNLSVAPPNSLAEAEARLPTMTQDETRTIKYTRVPDRAQIVGLSASQITSQSIDMTHKFELMYNTDTDKCLCEIQFAFITFLIGHCYDSFEQWKRLINIVCNCQALVSKHTQFYIDFISIVYYQLKEMPQDLFVDITITTKDNFLIVCLHNLIENLMSANGCDELTNKCEKFKIFLNDYFEHDVSMEPDEYAPVVVMIDQESTNK